MTAFARTVFTVHQLHKRLGKLIEQGHGRVRVLVDKTSFSHPRESDGVTMLDLSGMGIESVPMSNDDGGTATDTTGREKRRTSLVLVGGVRAGVNGQSPEYWRKTIEEQKKSGLTVIDFCRPRRICTAKFYRWRYRLIANDAKSRSRVEVALPGGIVVRVGELSPAGIAELVATLRDGGTVGGKRS